MARRATGAHLCLSFSRAGPGVAFQRTLEKKYRALGDAMECGRRSVASLVQARRVSLKTFEQHLRALATSTWWATATSHEGSALRVNCRPAVACCCGRTRTARRATLVSGHLGASKDALQSTLAFLVGDGRPSWSHGAGAGRGVSLALRRRRPRLRWPWGRRVRPAMARQQLAASPTSVGSVGGQFWGKRVSEPRPAPR